MVPKPREMSVCFDLDVRNYLFAFGDSRTGVFIAYNWFVVAVPELYT